MYVKFDEIPPIGARMDVGLAVGLAQMFLATENSDVLFDESVAVAVTHCPTLEIGTESARLNVALPDAFVVTCCAPSQVRPSPLPEGSANELPYRSTVNVW